MAHVNKIHLTCSYTFRYLYSFTDSLMRSMRFMAQSTDNQGIHTHQQLLRFYWHPSHIGHKTQSTNAKPKNGHVTVHYLQRHHLKPLDTDRLVWHHRMEVKYRHTRIQHLSEEVGHPFTQMGASEIIGKNINAAKTAEGTQVIDATRVVVMFMSEKHTIKAFERHTKHLFTKVGTTVDKNTCVIGFNKCRYA